MTTIQPATRNTIPVLAKRTTATTIIEGLDVLHQSPVSRRLLSVLFATGISVTSPASAEPPAKGMRPTAPRSRLRASKAPSVRRVRPERIHSQIPPRWKDRDLGAPYDQACRGVETLRRREGKTPFSLGEELSYELSVSGAYVGRMETKVGRPRKVEGRRRLVLFGRARTNQLLTALKPFVGRYMAMVDPVSLSPLGVRTELTYGTDARWERIRFEHNQRGVRTDYLLRGREKARQYGDAEHDLTDVLTLLYVARTVELDRGLEVCQDVFGARRLWRMTAAVEGSRAVRTPAGEMDSWFVRSVFDRKPTPGLSRTKRPRIEMDVFLAKDETQAPLQFVVRLEGVEAVGRLVRWSTRGRTSEAEWGI